jgi:hypothetical protein
MDKDSTCVYREEGKQEARRVIMELAPCNDGGKEVLLSESSDWRIRKAGGIIQLKLQGL